MKTISATKHIEVCFSDVDSLQIVWHGKYVKYFEDAREYFGKKYNFGYMTFYEHKCMLPLVDLEVSYKKMVAYDEILRVEITYVPTESAKVIFTYEIFNQSDELVCTGKTVQVMTSVDKKLMLTNPDFVKDWKQKWLEAN
ncbi:1,4-dihydroxy-2-naphthoyl-CoA hydrolase [Kordia antarctica]|uniref:1,4-dihydroxy-2-naphthoyl-CoA hydrolase n=1 Tax=Kordia antarctica TaxID=1218801 RepID=A0A7L4ZKY2_9FLAO|nr:acyl-CoA thioesterase [Kordia antarctica]QHI36886.1 1,4-dihydroxy-2-naphthoyl-CoA hydrolase [Kordia antarctica]